MIGIRCPYCGAANIEAAARDARSFICASCGKAVEPPTRSASALPGQEVVPPPPQVMPQPPPRSECWSDGPPAESADRWSAVPPAGHDDSSPSLSVSQTSLLPNATAEPPLVRPARSPLVWLIVILLVFSAALAGVIVLARNLKPWLIARREAAERKSVDYWLPKLENGSIDERQNAAKAIVALGPPAVVTTLEKVSHDPDNDEDFAFVTDALHSLAAVGPDASDGLRAALQSPEARVRAAAANVVQEMGPAGRATCAELIAALDDDNRWVRLAAIGALKSLGPAAAPATKKLTALISTRDATGRRAATDALGRIGPDARDALPALEAIANDNTATATLRDAAKQAINQIDVVRLARAARRDAKGELKRLLKAVMGGDSAKAIEAAKTLGEMGFAAQPAAAGLAAMLHDADAARRAAAADALGKIGLGAADFIPTLESTAAGDDDAGVRAAAAKALQAINGKPK